MGSRRGKGGAALSAVCAAALAWAVQAQTPSFTLMGVPTGYVRGGAWGVSADGQVVAGHSIGSDAAGNPTPGFVWTRENGRDDFGLSVGTGRSRAWGISGDGSVVVGGGQENTPENSRAFRWSQAGGYQDLGLPTGFARSRATDVNHDGTIIAGTNTTAGGARQGFRWTAAAGMQMLPSGTEVSGMSRDGITIIGNLGTAQDGFVWTEAGGMQFLPNVGGGTNARASGVNFDGSIVVGNSGAQFQGTMWLNGVPMSLDPTGTSPINLGAGAVSDDGAVVAGTGQMNGDLFAAVWTPSTGIVSLTDYLAANGVMVPQGFRLTACTSISGDGLTFVGNASGPGIQQGFVATIPSPGAVGVLGAAAFVCPRRRRIRNT